MAKTTIKVPLCSTVMAAVLTATPWVTAQDAVPVSNAQFGYDTAAVQGVSGTLEIFGGGNEHGALYGGAASIALPVGRQFGVKLEATGGVAPNDESFFGAGGQIFYRDPNRVMLGLSGAGYTNDGAEQYAISAIAEYYIDNVTLEALAGYTWGDAADKGFLGRAGIAYYATDDIRIGGGISYTEGIGVGGDLGIEALVSHAPGLSLFATALINDDTVTGIGGIRLYISPGDTLRGTNRTKAANSGFGLSGLQRLGGLASNLLAQVGTGLTSLGTVSPGGLASAGSPLSNVPIVSDLLGALPSASAPTPTPSAPAPLGVIDLLQMLGGNVLADTPLEPLATGLDTLLDPATGTIAPLTGPLNDGTKQLIGNLAPLTAALYEATGNKGILDPLTADLHELLTGDTASLRSLSILTDLLGPESPLANMPMLVGLNGTGSGAINGLPLVGDLLSLLSSPTGGGTYAPAPLGLIDLAQMLGGNVLTDTPLEPLATGLDTLLDPTIGTLAPLTSPLNDGSKQLIGNLTPLTTTLYAATGDKGILDPLTADLHELLTGDTSSLQSLSLVTDLLGPDSPLANMPLLDNFLGTLSGQPDRNHM